MKIYDRVDSSKHRNDDKNLTLLKEVSTLVVRFLVLVTTMVTKVDHSNYRSSAFPSFSYYDGNQG